VGIRLVHRLFAGVLIPLVVSMGPATSGPASPAPGADAWVQVSVATIWIHPSSPRPIDELALADPARIRSWLEGLGFSGRLGLNGRVDSQMLFGTRVLVLGQEQDWSRVEVPDQRGALFPHGIIGWVPSRQLSATPPSGEVRSARLTPTPDAVRDVIVSVPSTYLYTVPDRAAAVPRFLLSYDTELPEVASVPGYVVVGLPGGTEGAIPPAAVAPPHFGPTTGGAIVAQARQFLGLSYLWGGTSAFGYDCSGLVYSLFARYGINLPRNAADQQHATVPVPLSHARPGDLLFFAGPGGKGQVEHVAIYAGDGWMIDAPYTGASIEEIPMRSSPAWPDFASVGRVRGVS
jgi:gamma-D-glutamyl-L-lysine dipeptidyl-peptidase